MSLTADTNLFPVTVPETRAAEDIILAVQSVLSALRLGRPFLVQDTGGYHLCLAIEHLDEDGIATFHELAVNRPALLVLSGERADTLGFSSGSPISMSLSPSDTAKSLLALASKHPSESTRRPILEQHNAAAVIDLLKQAQTLPACLFVSDVKNARALMNQGILSIEASAIAAYPASLAATLKRKSEAPIPVRGGIDTRMVVFQYATSDTEIALLVGNPDPTKELPIRIHSACATGDIFGSERCDCGDQLRLAIEKLNEIGGGAILYLDQEGRGIGLVNKIRAYGLQDQALDTVDANRTLGFADDMRGYSSAVAMVRALGWDRVSILTNNPNKVRALEANGLHVVERIAHQAPLNSNNSHYLKTKAARSGHLLKYK